MEPKEKLEELKIKILAEAISAIDIIDVEILNIREDSIHLRFKTNNLETVDSIKLIEICNKYSNQEFYISSQIPDEKVRDGLYSINLDLVCIFIETLPKGPIDFNDGRYVQFG